MPGSRTARSRLLAIALMVAAVTCTLFGLQSVGPASAQTATLAPWELLNLPSPVVRVVTAPNGVLFASSSIGLSRSDDGGDSWIDVPLPNRSTASDPSIQPGPLRSLAIHPVDPLRLFVRAADGIARTTDGGATWTTVLRVQEPTLAMAISPADPSLVFVTVGSYSSSYSLFRSQDGGDSWEELDHPRYDTCAWDTTVLYPHPTDAERLFISSNCTTGRTTEAALQIRTNRGATVGTTYMTEHGRGRQPVAFAGGTPTGRFLMGLGDLQAIVTRTSSEVSIMRSDDDGATWLQVLSVGGTASTAVRNRAGTPVPGVSWDLVEPIRFDLVGVAIGPADPPVAYVGIAQVVTVGKERPTSGRILRYALEPSSTDSEYVPWRDLAITSQGRLLDLAVSTDGQFLYAATENGLWRLPDPLHQPPH